MADIFISHSSRDSTIAEAIGQRIRRERPTWSLFYDRDGIRAGQKWQPRLRQELQGARVVLAVLTRDWLASPWCFAEAVTAAFRGKDFVGVEAEDLSPEDLGRAPPIVAEHQRVRLRDGDEQAWREVLDALDRSGLDPDEWFPIPEGVGPYPGLVAFDEKDAGVFFGRKQETTDYLDRLNTLRAPDRSQVLVISGGSGSGKSSLLRAGLLPRLRRKREWCVVAPFEVAREPVRNLSHALAEALAGLDVPADGLDLGAAPTDPGPLTETLEEVFRRLERKSNAWVLLPLDQAEALLAASQTSGEAACLLDALARLLARRTRRIVVVATIRSEFVDRLSQLLVGEQVQLCDVPLGPIRAVSDVIEKPAERFGIALEPGLAGRILEDVRSADALPLLAYILRELYEQHAGDGELTLDEYHELGGVHGAIGARLGHVLTDPAPTPQECAALRRAFTCHLIRVDEGAAEGERYLRRPASRASLPQAAGRLLDRLVEARLLIAKSKTVELAHERLIDDWTWCRNGEVSSFPIRTWLAQDAADRTLIDQLRRRDGDDVLPDGLLARAEEMLRRDPELAREEPDVFARVTRSRRTKTRRKLSLVAAALVLALLAKSGWDWITADMEARRIERSHALAAEAESALARGAVDVALNSALKALPEAVKGREVPDTPEAEHALRDAVLHLADGRCLPTDLCSAQGLNQPRRMMKWAAFTPERDAIVTASRDGSLEIWPDADCGPAAPPQPRQLEGKAGEAVIAGAFAREGHWLALACLDGTAAVLDLTTGISRPLPMPEGVEYLTAIAFSPDDARVLTASGDGRLRLWKLADGTSTELSLASLGVPRAVAFDPTGRHIAAGTSDGQVALLGWAPAAEVEAMFDALAGHGRIVTIRFGADGSRLLAASEDGTVAVWELEARKLLGRFLVTGDGRLEDARISPDGARLLTGWEDGKVRLWDFQSAELWERGVSQEGPLVLSGPADAVTAVDFSPDGQRVLAASADGTARIWCARRFQRFPDLVDFAVKRARQESRAPEHPLLTSSSRPPRETPDEPHTAAR